MQFVPDDDDLIPNKSILYFTYKYYHMYPKKELTVDYVAVTSAVISLVATASTPINSVAISAIQFANGTISLASSVVQKTQIIHDSPSTLKVKVAYK